MLFAAYMRNRTTGTIILTEDQLPDCELPLSEDPTCEVNETEDGDMVLVAARDIAAGEWFSITNEDSDDDDESGDEESDLVQDEDEEA